ncbi:MAG: outer membrane protein assembly factor BamD [Desulfuromonas sp.]|nr:MAG: outer membrane protein assembly factor BamD [Desulfuromonas sp.]
MRTSIIFLLTALLLSACGTQQLPPTRSAAYYFQEGERLFERELYEDAVASWERVRDSYYSPELNILAELKIAEAYYLAEMYVEAAATYESFLKNHPDSDHGQRVLYYLGMSYYKQVLPANRDQTATHNTIVTFRNLLKLYPETSQKVEVEDYIHFCRNRLAQHEVLVGRFYVRTDKADAAIMRLEAVLADYPDFTTREQLYYLLGEAYLQKEDKTKAVESFNNLYANYPDSKYIKKAKKSLSNYF